MQQHKILIYIAIIFSLIAAIIVTQITSSQKISNDDIQQQLRVLISFANESSLLLSLYANQKVTNVYMQHHITYINQHVTNFYSEIASKKIPANKQQSLTIIDKNVFDFSMQLKTAEVTKQDPEKLQQIRTHIEYLRQQFQNEEEKYE